jgi:hypothetical protein
MRKAFILATLVVSGAASAQQVQPGLWESSSKVTAMSGPDMPPNVSAMMASRPPIVVKQCIRPADAAKGFEQMLKDKSRQCVVKSSRTIGGVIDVQSQCTSNGQVSTMHMHGPFTPTAYTLNSEMVLSGESKMKMSMIFSAKRIGPCG